MFDVPILIIIFNRPSKTKEVFETLKILKPRVLYVSADGPRLNNQEDIINCSLTREIISPDWPCKLQKNYYNHNLGCGIAPKNAIDWFFNNVEEGIILEDDCIPCQDFYTYCKILLHKYRYEEKVFFIGGTNFQKEKWGNSSYYFSAGNQGTWGWATWKRSWNYYKYSLDNICDAEIHKVLAKYFTSKSHLKYWKQIFDKVKRDCFNNSCWDYQFYLSGWIRGALAIIPNVNLVNNTGSGADATHTKSEKNRLLNQKTDAIIPIMFNDKINQNIKADEFFFSTYLNSNESKLFSIIKKAMKLLNIILNIFKKWIEIKSIRCSNS